MHRRGFTLIEILVVITIIGVLIALLIPAVQSAREAARKLQCSNNLKQIGLGIIQYEHSYRQLPLVSVPTIFGYRTPNLSSHGWASSILPYLEQETVYSRIDFKRPANHRTNIPAVSTVLPVFLCPATDRVARDGQKHLVILEFAVTDYAATRVVRTSADEVHSPGAWGEPILGDPESVHPTHYRRVSLTDVLDGTSQTTLAGEAAGLPVTYSGGGEGPWQRDDFNFGSGRWGSAGHGIQILRTDHDWGTINFRNSSIYSFHPGGANVVFCDGSVHFLREGTDPFVVEALVTREAGDVADASAWK
jgi:prepilin-type N-terminal cleavage/methylation domain-containing protein/prepilin-type processing-associated H-X9-DG protein